MEIFPYKKFTTQKAVKHSNYSTPSLT